MFNNLYDNVGSKMKKTAKISCKVGIVVSIVGGIALTIAGEETLRLGGSWARGTGLGLLIPGLVLLVLGPLFSWLGYMKMYALGEMAENSDIQTDLLVRKEMSARRQDRAEHGGESDKA